MAGRDLDFQKLPANQHITFWIGPTNAVRDLRVPTAAEINAMKMASHSISWNDYDFGMQASEQVNDPSLADVAEFQEIGASNYGGNVSFYIPRKYDDASNPHSQIYDLTEKPGTNLLVVTRLDGEKKTSKPAADGDLVSCYLVQTDSESNSIEGADAMRRTVGMLQQSNFSYYTVVGGGTLVSTPGSITGAAGTHGRLVVKMGDRDVTNMLKFTSDDPEKILVYPGGVYTLKSGTGNVTVSYDGVDSVSPIQVGYTVS